MNNIEKRYLDGSYLSHNSTWDREHAPWKAKHIKKLIYKLGISPKSICDIGCGSGDLLVEMRKIYNHAELHGYDISPDLDAFWKENIQYEINFHLGDISSIKDSSYDFALIIDLIEHLSDPFSFLETLKGKANYYIFHIPLDLSVLSVARETPLLSVREKVGHIHYYTKSLALAMLQEAEFTIVDWHYTDAYRTIENSSIKTKLSFIPRLLLQKINKDMAARVLGGNTLMVLASC